MFQWNAHRFSGGRLALDVVNTVVCRGDPARRTDRFAQEGSVVDFARAATQFCSDEVNHRQITPPPSAAALQALLHLREATNAWLRPQSSGEIDNPAILHRLFKACAAACSPTSSSTGEVTLGEAAARSAMAFFDPALVQRTRICPNCDWLFVDKSKNRSRLWCDMNVCGNRAKARAHYARRRKGEIALRVLQ